MRRRDISKVLLASATGSTLLTRQAEAQTCSPPCFPRTAAEIAAGVTPTNYAFNEGSVFRYGAIGNDSFNNLTPLQNAIAVMSAAGGGPVEIGAGTFRFSSTLTLKAGVSLFGRGVRTSILKYTGAGVAIVTEDVYGSSTNHSSLEYLKLTTTTNSPSVGPGTHGLLILNGSWISLDHLEIRGFSTAGVQLQADTSKAAVYVNIGSGVHIHENAVGLSCTGVNGAINQINIDGAQIRANTMWNIYSDLDMLGWKITGCALEAGGTSGSGGAVHLNGIMGVDISGNYFEQSGGAAGLPAIDISYSRPSRAISIKGNFIQGSGSGTAIRLGTSALVKGVEITGNEFSSWTTAINPAGVTGGLIAANSYDFVATPVATPGGNCTALVIVDTNSVKTYGAPVSQLTWNGAAWISMPFP